MTDNERISTRGSSLLEMVLVLLSLAIMTALSVPALASLGKERQIKEELQRLEGILRECALRSLLSGDTIEVTFDNHSYTVLAFDPSMPPLEARRMPAAISIDPPHNGRIVFRGGGTSSPATVLLTSSRSVCRIVVSLRGRIKSLCGPVK